MTDRSFWRQLADAITHTGPSYQPEPLPRRRDQVERWLKAQRDAAYGQPLQWETIDSLLDDYRLHADTRTPLDQHCCENGTVDDCADCYDTKEPQR